MKNDWIPFISYVKKHELSIKILELSNNLRDNNVYTGFAGPNCALGSVFRFSKDIILYLKIRI